MFPYRKHWNLRYLINRSAVWHFRASSHRTLPNLAVPAIQFLNGWLRNTDRIFEFGAGYSTEWFGKRVGKVVSVESDPVWYDRVLKLTKSLGNVSVHLIDTAERVTHLAPYEPFRISWDYVNKISDFDSESFDFILNDGWVRPLVANAALGYLKPGGVFCWDDFHSYFPVENTSVPNPKTDNNFLPEIRHFLMQVEGWRKVIFDDGVHCTALFFKPAVT